MNTWSDFNTLTTLKISFTDSIARSATIYGNGNNQVSVSIRVKAIDKNQKPIILDGETLASALYLCDYRTGEEIPFNTDSDSVRYSRQKNEYCNAVNYDGAIRSLSFGSSGAKYAVGGDGSVLIDFYISAGKMVNSKLIAAGIRVPNVGAFDTSETGTATPNGPGGHAFRNVSCVNIKVLSPINYGVSENVKITSLGEQTISNSLQWVSRFSTLGPWKEHYTGKCQRAVISIRPNVEKTGGDNKFMHHEISYSPVNNDNVSQDTIKWDAIGSDDYPCFSVIKTGGRSGAPCAVIGRGIERDDYQVNIFYSRKNKVDLDGYFFVGDNSYYYRFAAKANENHMEDDEGGAATLLLYKFIMPENNCAQYNWIDAINSPNVVVADAYGNKGEFKLFFNDSDHFDIPAFSES
ncbi:hypothetical protein [Photorhabdus luminescens]|uniref:Uncharacterized protein n=1 Tax=Photorhabdus luminescens subsp. mexicana TaxID=2100167 RepID=A0A4R4JQ30_PHOLU|nr:hypothetical protein [Photorhabdus luminescens]TDB56122.1 hypothetical protein C5468_02635 [Photorhabdus luminescens subsp. mexicana]